MSCYIHVLLLYKQTIIKGMRREAKKRSNLQARDKLGYLKVSGQTSGIVKAAIVSEIFSVSKLIKCFIQRQT